MGGKNKSASSSQSTSTTNQQVGLSGSGVAVGANFSGTIAKEGGTALATKDVGNLTFNVQDQGLTASALASGTDLAKAAIGFAQQNSVQSFGLANAIGELSFDHASVAQEQANKTVQAALGRALPAPPEDNTKIFVVAGAAVIGLTVYFMSKKG